MTTELRVVCSGSGTHNPVELAAFIWTPRDLSSGAAWDPSAPLRDLDLDVLRESARATKSQRPNKVTTRSTVDRRTRADGGTTFILPACPRCHGAPRVELRDDTIRHYTERTRDTPLSGRLDLAHIRMV